MANKNKEDWEEIVEPTLQNYLLGKYRPGAKPGMTPMEKLEAELNNPEAQALRRQLADESVRTIAASSPMTAEAAALITKPIRWAGDKIKGLGNYVASKAAGLSPQQAEIYQKAPKAIEALRQAPADRKQDLAKRAIESASKSLSKRAGKLNEELAQEFAGKSVPQAELSGVTTFKPNMDPITGAPVSVADVYKQAQAAGKASKFSPAISLDPLKDAARAADAGADFAALRTATSKAAPGADTIIKGLQEGIEAQSTLRPGLKRPMAFLQTKSGDRLGNIARVDELVGRPTLQKMSDKLSTAQALDNIPEDFLGKVSQGLGKAGLRANEQLSKAASATTKTGAGLGLGAYILKSKPKEKADDWEEINDWEDVK